MLRAIEEEEEMRRVSLDQSHLDPPVPLLKQRESLLGRLCAVENHSLSFVIASL